MAVPVSWGEFMGRLARGLSRRSLIALPVLVALTAGVGPAGAAQAGADHGMHKPADQAATPSAAAYRPYAQLSSVSCPRVRWCVAVGFHTLGSGPALYPLAEAWNGRSWRLLKAPVIRGMFLGIACPRRGACIAVGGRDNRNGIQASPLAATWNGFSWRLRKTAHIGSNFDVINLASISCKSPHRCIAVSGYGGAEPTESAAVEAWNGRRWRLRTVFGQSSLNGVACKTIASCLAVGSTSPASDSWVPFGVVQTSSKWQTVATPPGDSGDLDTSLSGVSCATTTLCMAVGEGMLIDQWTGHAWRQLTVPGPGQLAGVSCHSAASCVAVGQDGQSRAAAQVWNGEGWRVLSPVHPSGPSYLASVRCPRPARCMAVGFYGTPFVRHTLAERWDGTTWRRLKTPAV
jgi:hypothetical protein